MFSFVRKPGPSTATSSVQKPALQGPPRASLAIPPWAQLAAAKNARVAASSKATEEVQQEDGTIQSSDPASADSAQALDGEASVPAAGRMSAPRARPALDAAAWLPSSQRPSVKHLAADPDEAQPVVAEPQPTGEDRLRELQASEILRVPMTRRDPIHDDLLDQFSRETGVPREQASQHSPEYEQWLLSMLPTLNVVSSGYVDNAISSTKPVRFDVTFSRGAKEDYIIVNWWKGYMKDSSGVPFQASLYGAVADINSTTWKVDSADPDPAYWSDPTTGRWNYVVDGPNAFHARDNPGPMNTSDGVGASAQLEFKTAVYKASEVPTTTTGSLSAIPLTAFQPWDYHVVVQGGGKFKHT